MQGAVVLVQVRSTLRLPLFNNHLLILRHTVGTCGAFCSRNSRGPSVPSFSVPRQFDRSTASFLPSLASIHPPRTHPWTMDHMTSRSSALILWHASGNEIEEHVAFYGEICQFRWCLERVETTLQRHLLVLYFGCLSNASTLKGWWIHTTINCYCTGTLVYDTAADLSTLATDRTFACINLSRPQIL